MDDIEAKVIETITQLNDEENLGIDFPESYIEDLSKAFVKNDLTDDELAQLIRKLKQAYGYSDDYAYFSLCRGN